MLKICKIDGCNKTVHCKDLCDNHYRQYLRKINKNLPKKEPSKTCSVEGCNKKHCAKGFCQNHYYLFKKYGYIPERTIYSPNEIIEYEDYAEIILYNNKCEEIARAIIDLDDIDIIKKYKWCLSLSTGYVVTMIKGKQESLHRFIMNPSDNMVIDHINHDKLDNRRSNLRICTQQQNTWNMSISKNNKTGKTGVRYIKEHDNWEVVIYVDGKNKYIGRYESKEEAIKVREEVEEKYFKEFKSNNN